MVTVPVSFTVTRAASKKKPAGRLPTTSKKLKEVQPGVSQATAAQASSAARMSVQPVQRPKPAVTDFAQPTTPLSTQDALVNQGVDLGGGPSSSHPRVTIYNFRINGGSGTTENRNVVLTHSTTNNPTHYRVSESPGWAQVPWMAYVPNPTYTLSPGTGVKTVYLQIKGQNTSSRLGNPQPNLASASASIGYYSEPLTATNFRTTNGSNDVLSRQVLLTWNVSGAAAGHRVSESANMAGVAWQTA